MDFTLENIPETKFLLELFILMLGAFIIGYFFGSRKKTKKGKTHNSKPKDINEIETIFSEIKPEIIKMIQEHKSTIPKSNKIKNKSFQPELNFDSFGYADEMNKDDLTKIDGISPFIEDKLNQLGIFSFSQISRFTKEDIATVTHLIEYFPGRIDRDDWVGQSKKKITKKAAL
ncbi:hypothetical protein [Planktosalinus lacus]|uniref:Uncharacterized protein n=1 Tax=Planktosalinus lacus TaxID=1526573 RepID=A0A8J2Y8M4_9FLAO|nr:hypothetical protein [Planktosalinus lacus]GGD94223.1 hypothetical protein GCM10011312_17430 [Planktosalinus lacus]